MMNHCARCAGAVSAGASRLILSELLWRVLRAGRARADAGHHRPRLSLAYAQSLIRRRHWRGMIGHRPRTSAGAAASSGHISPVAGPRVGAMIFHNSIKKPGRESTATRLKGSKAMNDIASAADGRYSLIERGFDLPFGYRATLIWRRPYGPLEVCWSPDHPCIRKPRQQRKFLAAYQVARREFFEEVAAVVGGRVLILDTGLKSTCGHDVIVPPTQHCF
jgi:hypothetical protein